MSETAAIWLGILIGALFVLVKSAQYMNRAAERIGLALGIAPFIVGVLLLAVGTSLPELITSILASLKGSPTIILGNVIGSNVTNLLLVLGLTAVFSRGPIRIVSSIIATDLTFLLASALLFTLCLSDHTLQLFEAIALVIIFVIYLIYVVRQDQAIHPEDELDKPVKPKAARPPLKIKYFVIFITSGAGLYFGADYAVEAVIKLSDEFQIAHAAIATTAIALGTSLPELMVNISAIRRGHGEMALGNVLGSCIFNLLLVAGVSGMLGPISGTRDFLWQTLPYMLAATFLCFFLSRNRNINRSEGFILLIAYVLFVREVLLGVVG